MQHYFVKSIENNRVILHAEDEHHIMHVMRMRSGDNVVAVFDAKKYKAVIQVDANKKLEVSIVQEMDENRELPVEITLIYGMPKGEKFEWVLQKATELGVSRIVPLISKRSIVKVDNLNHKMQRWQRIVKEASEQSKRSKIPQLQAPITNEAVKQFMSEINLVAYEKMSGQTMNMADYLQLPAKSISILVGCEGGFEKEEISLFEQFGFRTISLGKRILRSETAALHFLSVLAFLIESGDN